MRHPVLRRAPGTKAVGALNHLLGLLLGFAGVLLPLAWAAHAGGILTRIALGLAATVAAVGLALEPFTLPHPLLVRVLLRAKRIALLATLALLLVGLWLMILT